ncbi:hypothetical protein D3C87_1943600 [compost metagenome]
MHFYPLTVKVNVFCPVPPLSFTHSLAAVSADTLPSVCAELLMLTLAYAPLPICCAIEIHAFCGILAEDRENPLLNPLDATGVSIT